MVGVSLGAVVEGLTGGGFETVVGKSGWESGVDIPPVPDEGLIDDEAITVDGVSDGSAAVDEGLIDG